MWITVRLLFRKWMYYYRMVKSYRLLTIGTLLWLACGGIIVIHLNGQAPPLFSVVSPANGQVFHMDENVLVAIQPAPGVTIAALEVLSPLGLSAVASAGPISIRVWRKNLGAMRLAITGATADGRSLEVTRTIQVEPTGSPTHIVIGPGDVRLAVLETRPVLTYPASSNVAVLGNFQGKLVDITASSQTVLSSDNTKVARVSSSGSVAAVEPGRTTIRARYGVMTSSVVVTVNVFGMRGDLNGDNVVDQVDLTFLLTYINRPSSGSGDPRDLNGDGRVDALDSRVLATLCTRPRCAVQ